MRGRRCKGSNTRWIAARSAGRAWCEPHVLRRPPKCAPPQSELPARAHSTIPRMWSVRSGDGLQQRLEPFHVLADVRIEVAESNIAGRYCLRPNLFRELSILARRDDCVVKGLQQGPWRLRGSQEAVPSRVLVIDTGCECGRD